MTLFFDVLLNNFVGDVATADTEIPSCPEVAAPELLSQMGKLVHQLVRTLPFQHLEQPTDVQTRRHALEQMYVIACHMTFLNRDFVSAADFADQLSKSGADFTSHDGFAILCHPDDVQVNAKHGVRAMSIVCHGLGL